jgi:hypothetical protein
MSDVRSVGLHFRAEKSHPVTDRLFGPPKQKFGGYDCFIDYVGSAIMRK